MEALTPAERRGALLVVLLLALGAVVDLWRASRPPPAAVSAARAPPPGDAAWPEDGGSPLPAPGREAEHPPEAPPVLDLNRASARELDALPGIGPVLAQRIVSHRERHGPFRAREELLAVRGIGPRLYARLRSRVAAGSGEPPGARAAEDSTGHALPGTRPP